MNCSIRVVQGILISVVAVIGCGRGPQGETSISSNSQYVLAKEPDGALDVMDFREKAKDGEPVVVLGRLGGGVKPWIDGRGAFLLVDERIVATCKEGEKCEEGCPHCAQALAEATTMVKFVDESGKVLATDARQILGAKEPAIVVVQGIASRDKSGNVSVVAEGVYIRR